jgi:hypothetical protein
MSIKGIELTEEEYQIKYLKYKEKYLALKNQSGGIRWSCNAVSRDAGWQHKDDTGKVIGEHPCNGCKGSSNPLTKCCRGFKPQGDGLKKLFKSAYKKGGQGKGTMKLWNQMCNCGHYADQHNPEAKRSQVQDQLLLMFKVRDTLANVGLQQQHPADYSRAMKSFENQLLDEPVSSDTDG